MKYLFEATYKDGSTYTQNAEDISLIEPEKRSCFFDVKQDELATFKLTGDGHTYLVDLRDGHFEVDRVPFSMHQGSFETSGNPEKLEDFRLVYFRNNKIKVESFYDNRESIVRGHEVMFCLGWQTNDSKGKNVQHIIEIK